FKRESRCTTAAFFHGALICAATGVRLDLIGRTKDDVSATAIGFPTRDACSKMFVRVCDPTVMLFLEFVLHRVRGRIASEPEALDKVVPLFIVRQLLERGAFLVGDDPAH